MLLEQAEMKRAWQREYDRVVTAHNTLAQARAGTLTLRELGAFRWLTTLRNRYEELLRQARAYLSSHSIEGGIDKTRSDADAAHVDSRDSGAAEQQVSPEGLQEQQLRRLPPQLRAELSAARDAVHKRKWFGREIAKRLGRLPQSWLDAEPGPTDIETVMAQLEAQGLDLEAIGREELARAGAAREGASPAELAMPRGMAWADALVVLAREAADEERVTGKASWLRPGENIDAVGFISLHDPFFLSDVPIVKRDSSEARNDWLFPMFQEQIGKGGIEQPEC